MFPFLDPDVKTLATLSSDTLKTDDQKVQFAKASGKLILIKFPE